jgi:hypothetical protein
MYSICLDITSIRLLPRSSWMNTQYLGAIVRWRWTPVQGACPIISEMDERPFFGSAVTEVLLFQLYPESTRRTPVPRGDIGSWSSGYRTGDSS